MSATAPAIELTVIRDIAALHELVPAWRTLAGGARFRGPDWLLPWWHAYQHALDAELYVIAGRLAGELVCVVPLYTRTVKSVLDVRELRLMGDAGPRPPALNMVSPAAANVKDRCGVAVAKLIAEATDWDLMDLEPLADPSRMRATLIGKLVELGFAVESSPSAGGARKIALVGIEADDAAAAAITVATDEAGRRKSMSALRRLSRLEWAERDERSPLADTEAAQVLEEAALQPGARVIRLDDAVGEAVAVALVLDDRERAVVVAMAVDPQASVAASNAASVRLLHGEALAAAARGLSSLEVCSSANEYPLPHLPTSRRSAVAVRVWRPGASSTVSRTVRTVQRGARRAVASPVVAASQARAAWSKIRSVAGAAVGFDRVSLLRGQLWTRGIVAPPGLTIDVFTEADFDNLDEHARADLIEQLVLDEARARHDWRRGDTALLAHLGSRPAGIVWTARGTVEVPELQRTITLSKHEAFVHDAFVAVTARGRAVAPVMLEQVAQRLRDTDAYRSWAIIAPDNQASLRAFQKASYTPVCDVIHAHVGAVEKLLCRPPDPEARTLLGLL